MSDILDSIVVKFGEDVASEGLASSIMLDDELNGTDEDGNAITSFEPGDTVHILVQLPPGYYISKIKQTSGTTQSNGIVNRDTEESGVFFVDDSDHTLALYPNSAIGVFWYGNTSALTVTENIIKASNPPCICNLFYSFYSYSITVYTPDSDEEWLLGIVIEAES